MIPVGIIQVGWIAGANGDTITVTLDSGGTLLTRTIKPESMHNPGTGSAGPIVTPQVVAFEIDANGPAIGNMTVVYPNSGNVSATDNHPSQDAADSDAAVMVADAVIAHTTGGPGADNHGLDYGFKVK